MRRIPVDLSGVNATLDRSAARRLADVWDGPGQECPLFGQEQSDPVAEPGPLWPRIHASMVLLAAIAGVMWFQLHDFGRHSEHAGMFRGSLRGAGAFARHGSAGDVQMKIQTAASVAAFVVAAAGAQAQQAVQWRVEDGGNGHWYGAVMEGRDWNAAESNARSIGGHLVTITSMQENAFLVSLGLPWTPSLNLIAYWTGGRKPAAGQPFAWISGEPWDYSNFDASERNGCCGTDVRFVVFRTHPGSEGRWDDTSVNGNMDQYPQRSIVEWSADCNSDGIVDYGQCRDGTLPDYDGDNVPDCCEQGVDCAAGGAGIVSVWGTNAWGERQIPGDLGDVLQIAGGNDHVVALRTDGTVHAWGRNSNGQTNVPGDLVGVTQVEGGGDHSVALRSDGTVVCWGGNSHGQRNVPALLPTCMQVDAGGLFTVALGVDGIVRAWGLNNYRQTDVPGDLGAVTRIAVGDRHTAALRPDGTVRCWGSNSLGQSSVPTDTAGITTIAAGSFHTMALTADGTLRCWGAVNTVPDDVVGVRDIAGGGAHAIALLADGRVRSWGRCSEGQCQPPPALRCVRSIAGASYLTLSISSAQCCLADLNDDGVVQGADLGLMLAAWGSVQAGVAADINRDGAVDGNDLGLMLAGWGPCVP
jgi:hypothetical protein